MWYVTAAYRRSQIAFRGGTDEEARQYKALFDSLRSEGGTYSPYVTTDPLTPHLAVLKLRAEVAPGDASNTATLLLAVIESLASGEHDAFIEASRRKARANWTRWSPVGNLEPIVGT